MILSLRSPVIFTVVLSLFFVNSNFISAQVGDLVKTSSIYELKIGTKIRVRMDNEINSRSSSVNDTFTVQVAEPIIVQGIVVLPVETVITGRVVAVKSATSGGKGGVLKIRFESLRLKTGQKRIIDAVLAAEPHARSSSLRNTLAIIGGTAIGALIGAVSKVQGGVFVGAGIGAAAGTGAVLFRKGKEVRIKADEKFEIKLVKKVSLPSEGF